MINTAKVIAGLFELLIAIFVQGAGAQSVELKSVHLGVLEGPERDRFLAAHNAARAVVKVDPVKWSDELGKYALASLAEQKEQLVKEANEGWTKRKIALTHHRHDPKYGENVAGWVGSRGQSAEWAVAAWLREKAAFEKLNASAPYRVGDEEGKTETDAAGQERPIIVGHYTAIIWRTTTHIGAAKLEFELADKQATARTYSAIICNYDPPGNRQGE